MDEQRIYPPLRWLSYLVLLLMLVAMGWAAYVSVMHWSGIAV